MKYDWLRDKGVAATGPGLAVKLVALSALPFAPVAFWLTDATEPWKQSVILVLAFCVMGVLIPVRRFVDTRAWSLRARVTYRADRVVTWIAAGAVIAGVTLLLIRPEVGYVWMAVVAGADVVAAFATLCWSIVRSRSPITEP